MKTIIFFLLLCLSLNFLHAQEKTVQVPKGVLTGFKQKFPLAEKPHWEHEKSSEYEVLFRIEKILYVAKFDTKGKWLETQSDFSVDKLPAAVSQTINKELKGFKIEDCEIVETSEKGNYYEFEMEKGEDNYLVKIDENGKILKKVIDD